MKNKKLLFVLLPLVALVWGAVIYKVVQSLESPTPRPQPGKRMQRQVVSASVAPDTFHLLLGYRDPFLTGLPDERQGRGDKPAGFMPVPVPHQRVRLAVPPTTQEPARVQWPEVKFTGLIEHRQKNRRVAMVRINDEDHLLEEKQAAAGLKLVRLLPDSILVEFGKERRFVRKQ
jgi:hypothetical protein